MKRIVFAFLCLFILGAALRAVNVWRPVDRTSWRESDVASIARNYYREGMNPFYPRIDWRGDGPGYAEMEFPLYPWAIAVLYQVFGVHDVIGRILSYLVSLAAMWFFFKLARYLLPDTGAFIASLFFALSPVVISISNSLQPDGLMLLWYVVAVYAFVRWLEDDSQKHYVLAICATALAILFKASAAHLGLVFAFLIFHRQGWEALRNWRTWVFGVASLLPPLLWYRHAHHLYLTYGNSLGVSNETHWAGWDLFTDSSFIRGILHNEVTWVWMPAGILVAGFGLIAGRRSRAFYYGLAWLGAVFIFYLVAARTTGDSWAFYYHVIAVPPFALLVGQSIEEARRLTFGPRLVNLAAMMLAASSGFVFAAYVLDVVPGPRAITIKAAAWFGITASMVKLFFGMDPAGKGSRIGARWPIPSSALAICVLGLLAATFLYQVREDRDDLPELKAFDLLSCANAFAPLVPPGDLIVASGGPCLDPTGYPVAFNSSYMFYWMDRKGFNVCVEKQSIPAIESLAQRGARFFVAEKRGALDQKPGFEAELRQKYPVVKECDAAVMFSLRPSIDPNDQK